MIIQLAVISALGVVGFLLGGALGTAALVVAWVAVLIGWHWLQPRRGQYLPGSGKQSVISCYADFEEINDRLDELARQRRWELDKRLEIALMACENRTATLDELERDYDRGLRSAFGDVGPAISCRPGDEGKQ